MGLRLPRVFVPFASFAILVTEPSSLRALFGSIVLAAAQSSSPVPSALSVRITSPMGRTGSTAAVRIVAQVQYAARAPLGQVKFFVDRQLLGAVQQPPFAVEWIDENPFERREIAVEAVDALGNTATDTVVLEPFEITDAAEVASVLLEASVQDKKGRFVKDIDGSHFTVLEDGVPQALDLVNQEALGATFTLLVDSSGSMSRRMDFVQRTAATLAGYLTKRDQLLIAPFSKDIRALTGPTRDRATVIEAVQAIRPEGGTAILDSLAKLPQLLASTEGRRAVILITDGYDEHSSTSFEEALAAVKSSGATLYVVGIGGVAGISLKGERLLRQLALETGGRFFFPSRDEELAEVHDVLTQDVRNRYLITYTPQNQRADGTWRGLTVRTDDPTHVVRTRPGYFARKPPPIRPVIEFTAADENGQYLDLTAADIEIVENGAVQKLDLFQEAVEPVSIVLALDASGSMKRKETEVVASAREFISALRPQDKLAVVLFSDQPMFTHDLSDDRAAALAALDGYRASGGTALYDTLAEALLHLKRTTGRRVVVVMTDGRDENNPGTGPGSVRRLNDVMNLIQQTGTLMFGIGLGVNVDQEPLRNIAAQSGGRAFFPTDVTELPGQYRRVVDDLRRRYVLGYTSSHIQHDGAWRDVEIRVKTSPTATVRSAGGYVAPGQ
jgi:Ca-activated chloride channel homolog